jgi:hypothetical protein
MSLALRRFCYLLISVIGFVLFSPQSRSAEPEMPRADAWTPNKVVISVKLSENGHIFVVPVQICDKQYRFLLNTDEYYTRVDQSLLKGLRRLTYRQLGYSQAELNDEDNVDDETRLTVPPDLRVGSHVPSDLEAVEPADNLENFAAASGLEINGVLGMNVLQNLVMHIDPERDLMLLCEPGWTVPPPGKSTPLFLDNKSKAPHVKLTFASQVSEQFKIDISCYNDSGELSDRTFAQLGLNDGLNLLLEASETDKNGEPFVSQYFRIAGLTMAGVRTQNTTFYKGKENRVGSNFLLRQRVTLDFKNEKLYAETTRFAAVRERSTQDGFRLEMNDQGMLVVAVQVASVADQSGLKSGDLITAIDGINTKKLEVRALRKLSAPSVQSLTFDILRDGKALKIELPGEIPKQE